MARKRVSKADDCPHPTPAEFLGLCEATSLALRWCEASQALVHADVVAVAAVRSFIAGTMSRLEFHGAGKEVYTVAAASLYAVPPDHPVVQAHASARQAVLSLFGLGLSGKVNADTWRQWRHQLVTQAGTVGTLLRIAGADHQIQVATSSAESAAAEGAKLGADRRGPIAPGSPEAAWQLALGEVLALHRERQKLTREDIVVRVQAARPLPVVEGEGGVAPAARPDPLTAGQLARLEGGTAGARAPLGAVAGALGSSAEEMERLADRAVALAAKLSETIVGIAGERWYADAAAAYGDRFARALVCVAAASALKPAG